MMLIILYGSAKRLEKIVSPYGPIYFRKLIQLTPTDGLQISCFIPGLNRQHQTLLLLGGIPLRFDQTTKLLVKKFLCTAVGKIYQIRKTMLSELGSPMAEKLVCLISLDKMVCHLQ